MKIGFGSSNAFSSVFLFFLFFKLKISQCICLSFFLFFFFWDHFHCENVILGLPIKQFFQLLPLKAEILTFLEVWLKLSFKFCLTSSRCCSAAVEIKHFLHSWQHRVFCLGLGAHLHSYLDHHPYSLNARNSIIHSQIRWCILHICTDLAREHTNIFKTCHFSYSCFI